MTLASMMNDIPSDAVQRRLQRCMDLGERAFSVLLFAGFAANMAAALAIRPWDGLIIFSEGLVVLFMVLRRHAAAVSTRPMDWLLALAGTSLPMLVRAGGHPLAPPQVGASLMVAGLLFSIWGKLILRRSFGLAAANRGVVNSGAYAFVRHPIYAGYLVIYVGFLLLNPLPWNALVYGLDAAVLVLRILAEERVLTSDPVYARFRGTVRWRLAPGLF